MSTNWIKYHAMSMTSPLNQRPGQRMTRNQLVETVQSMFSRDPDHTPHAIATEIDRLIETDQLVFNGSTLENGEPIFEEAVPVSERSSVAARAIIENLKGRRGIGSEIKACDAEVRAELENTIAAIIDKNLDVLQ